jgi:hypothetical protein
MCRLSTMRTDARRSRARAGSPSWGPAKSRPQGWPARPLVAGTAIPRDARTWTNTPRRRAETPLLMRRPSGLRRAHPNVAPRVGLGGQAISGCERADQHATPLVRTPRRSEDEGGGNQRSVGDGARADGRLAEDRRTPHNAPAQPHRHPNHRSGPLPAAAPAASPSARVPGPPRSNRVTFRGASRPGTPRRARMTSPSTG